MREGARRNDSDYTAIVPAWNCERTVGRVLASLKRLKPAPRRIVVVDDGSTDGTRNALRAASANREDVIIISNERPGAGAAGPPVARNVGARGVTTEWILFVDSDCYVDAAGFERAWAVLDARSELDGLMGVVDARGPEDSLVGTYRNFRVHHDTLAVENPPPAFNSSCFLVRMAAFQAVGGFNEAFGRIPTEDTEFYFRLVAKGYRLEYDPAFRFFHDKPMSAIQIAREDRRRATAITLNTAGKLGAPPPSPSWQVRRCRPWTMKLLAGNVALLSIPVCLIVGWSTAWAVPPVLVLIVLAGPGARMVAAACRSFGPRFAVAVVLLHWIELLAVTAGIACALPGLMRRGKGLPAMSGEMKTGAAK